MAPIISREELEAELTRLGVGCDENDDALKTSKEWADAWNCSQTHVLELLRMAKLHGLLRIGNKSMTRVDNKRQRVAAYAFSNGKKKAKK